MCARLAILAVSVWEAILTRPVILAALREGRHELRHEVRHELRHEVRHELCQGVLTRARWRTSILLAVVAWNPVFYAIDGFRYGFTGSSEAAPALGVAILLAVDAVLFVAVYLLFASGYKLKA